MPNTTWHIYALSEPTGAGGQIRYVGKAMQYRIRIRFRRHLEEAMESSRRNHRLNWIRAVLASGAVPVMTILETGEGAGWVAAERRWIAHFREAGADLVNMTDGGEGVPGAVPSAETCAKLKAAWTPERRALMHAKLTGRKCSPETRERMRLAHSGKKASPEARAHMSAAHIGLDNHRRGYRFSAEARAKMSVTRCGRKPSPETCARMKAAHGSPEARAAAAIATATVWKDPVKRARIHAARWGKHLAQTAIKEAV